MADPPRKSAPDVMACRACGRDERASEGYPCDGCGTFICLICSFRGVTRCRACGGGEGTAAADHWPTGGLRLH